MKFVCMADSKHTRMAWKRKENTAPVKVKILLSADKFLKIDLLNLKSILCNKFLHKHRILNAVYYYQIMD